MRKRNIPDDPLTSSVNLPHMLTIPEVASMLKIGRTKVYGLIKSANFPIVQIGSAKRVPIAALHEWLKRRQKAS
jgi:excisionase family DNA binding protein